MEISKPVGIGIIVIASVLALAIVWYFTMGRGSSASGTVSESAYPEYKANPPLPDSELRGPEAPPPIAGAGGRR
ncbi:MAG: hypothetical protein N2651_02615 [Fimbriimonadales bacterium]|nr:hypothetical protein [Fimbriimonadales bacterium]